MQRETKKQDHIEAELRELMRLSQRFGYTSAQSCAASDQCNHSKAKELSAAAESFGAQAQEKLNQIKTQLQELRNEAYEAGLSDGELGEAMRRKGT